MRVFKDADFDWIGLRRKAYLVSATALAISVAGAIFWQVRAGSWLNYGVDFTGGTLVQVRFEEPVSIGELRSIVRTEVPDADVTAFGQANEYLIRAAQFTEAGESMSDLIGATLEGAFDPGEYETVRVEAVGPQVGGELRTAAIVAILLSFVLTLVYLAFRFEWRFGAAAVAATLHDTILTLGFLSLFQFDFTLTLVAALLTNIGYSLNDTIIVFDRIRENLHGKGRREGFASIANSGINDTLPRTALTSGTTFSALFALWVLGTEVIQAFALVLMFGVIVGTFSSIMVASPLLLEIRERWGEGSSDRKRSRKRQAAM